ncbi:tetratricopeptide repeat protein 22-like [Acanthaster planci]|uniref:Tetratricopeptide repeat protein 22-like n=1 Tax=Acanthaster planci TaxID=133434 RepID=A0A8B7Z979_ACAPL|nr:tetratricopeptide repeat protein 22-like [Acanthaster planci]
MALDISPGFYMLPLPINKDINIDRAVVETKLRDLDHFRRVRTGRSEELAILNLQGLLVLRLRRHEEALGYFHAVLAKDRVNLNALANLQYVLEKLFRMAEAQHCKDEQIHLLDLGESADSSKKPKLSESQRMIKARCLAEQAYAYAFDIHSDTVEGKRYMESNDLYRKALELGGKAVETTEKDDWKFCIAFNAHKLFDNLYYENKHSASKENIEIAVNLFYEITQRSPGDPEFQWDSWRHLADIFRALKIRKISIDLRQEFKEFQDDPEKCMLRAMKVSPNNARLLARYANFLYSLKKEIQKPLELLEQSISLDSSEFNFYAFTTRAMINIKHYYSQLREAGQDSSKMGLLRNVLQLAKNDLEKAMAMHVTPWDLARLGEVYYLLAKNHTEQDGEVRSLIEKALLHFTKAADCQDGHKRIEVHLMRGRCLFDIGEKRSAIGCYKQATDCEPAKSNYTGNFNELLNVYMSILHEEKPTKDKAILAEAAYCLKRALLKYGEKNMRTFCINKFRSAYADEFQQLVDYCGQYGELSQLSSLLAPVEPVSQASLVCVDTGGKLKHPWTKTFFHKAGDITKGDSGNTVKEASGVVADENLDVDADHAVSFTVSKKEAESDDVHEMASLARDMAKVGVKEQPVRSKEQPIRKALEKARVSSFEFDFFVVYPESQKNWVSYDLLVELEEIRKLKGCTRHRDAKPGIYVFRNEIELMKCSASILLINDKDFNNECEYSMNQAVRLRKTKDCNRVVIPITRDTSEIPEEISVFKFFDATGAVDWNKLALCIEQQIGL